MNVDFITKNLPEVEEPKKNGAAQLKNKSSSANQDF